MAAVFMTHPPVPVDGNPATPPPPTGHSLSGVGAVHITSGFTNQESFFQQVRTNATGTSPYAFSGGPYNFRGFGQGCGFGTTTSVTASDIGNATDGEFVESGNNPGLLAYQYWTLKPDFNICSIALCHGSFNMTDAARQVNLNAVAAGDPNMDFAWQTAGTRARLSGVTTIMRPGWECTSFGQSAGFGNYPWTALNIETSYVNAFQRCVTKLRQGTNGDGSNGFTGQVEWNVTGKYNGGNGGSSGGDFDSNAYPGDAYVDVIGVDFYDQGSGVDPVIDLAQAFALSRGKQVGFSEVGYFNSVGDDTGWTTSVITKLNNYPAKGQPGGLAYCLIFVGGDGGTATMSTVPQSMLQWKAALA